MAGETRLRPLRLYASGRQRRAGDGERGFAWSVPYGYRCICPVRRRRRGGITFGIFLLFSNT